jgi:hypothetical protein
MAARESDSPVIHDGEAQSAEHDSFGSVVARSGVGVHGSGNEDFAVPLYSFKPPRGRY